MFSKNFVIETWGENEREVREYVRFNSPKLFMGEVTRGGGNTFYIKARGTLKEFDLLKEFKDIKII